ncbi:Sin3 associated polypeptide p18-domain-containing protein [Massariosphaeria phaeospora]|uniref:Sin3 associated polypeptide p18-domain-containing protein n=1 Tax=Massariosphaeria phaeospora TaxID=100035 RepID=A0A7C8HZU5_9PLEO|nr:Sin3 associated polypeptide p18-domain-containing protein [Massariosphaeria phaeospora]
MAAPEPAKVDRQTTTPFLLRLFYKQGSFHRLEDFDPTLRLPPHLQIYTWPTCTLSELTSLLLTALPALLTPPYPGTRVAFRLNFPDTQSSTRPGAPGRFISRELGSVIVGAATKPHADKDGDGNGDGDENMEGAEGGAGTTADDVKEALKQLDGDPEKTLHDAKFVIGDYVSCAIFPPGPDGSVAPVPPPPSGPARGLPVRDGFGGGRGRENGFGRGDYGRGGGGGGYGGGGGGRGGRFDDRRGGDGVPSGEWRRGEAPPEREGGGGGGGGGYWRGGGGSGRGGGRPRGRW